jgi:hypothetical protein
MYNASKPNFNIHKLGFMVPSDAYGDMQFFFHIVGYETPLEINPISPID